LLGAVTVIDPPALGSSSWGSVKKDSVTMGDVLF